MIKIESVPKLITKKPELITGLARDEHDTDLAASRFAPIPSAAQSPMQLYLYT